MNVLEKIPKAQEAYTSAWDVISGTDNTELLEHLATSIPKCVELGRFVAAVGGLDPRVAEKTGIQLEQLGYSTSVSADQPSRLPDGKLEPRCVLQISWIHMPANKRDSYTV